MGKFCSSERYLVDVEPRNGSGVRSQEVGDVYKCNRRDVQTKRDVENLILLILALIDSFSFLN